MAYLELFERVADHVRHHGVKVTFKRGKSLSEAVIRRAQSRALIQIPSSMAEFYAEVGNGMVFAWRAEGVRAPFANHEFLKLGDVTLESLDEVDWRMEWKDDFDFRHTKDPKLAKQTALKMRKWVPFHHEGNGDGFCLDTAVNPAPVVFDQHDWYDGGTGENGHLLGRSLLEFYNEWSHVCFQVPRSLWWPRVFNRSGDGVNWHSNDFQGPFRLPA